MTQKQYNVYLQYLKGNACLIDFRKMETTGEFKFSHPDCFSDDVVTTYYYEEIK